MDSTTIMWVIVLTASISALLLSVTACIIGGFAYSEMVGMKNSTHQIQYIDSEEQFKSLKEQVNDDPDSLF